MNLNALAIFFSFPSHSHFISITFFPNLYDSSFHIKISLSSLIRVQGAREVHV